MGPIRHGSEVLRHRLVASRHRSNHCTRVSPRHPFTVSNVLAQLYWVRRDKTIEPWSNGSMCRALPRRYDPLKRELTTGTIPAKWLTGALVLFWVESHRD